MQVSIIGIGTELLNGKIDDTNSTYLSKQFTDLGLSVNFRINVNDSKKDIIQALKICTSNSDIIVLTGGLGPTDDDITLESLALFLNKKLYFNEILWKEIESFFIKRGYPVYESNKKQTYSFNGAIPLKNEHGTAPGIFYMDNKAYILLPGPPKENRPMFKNFVLPLLFKNNLINKQQIEKMNKLKKEIRVYNSGESALFDIFRQCETKNEILHGKGYLSDFIEIDSYFNRKGYIEIIFKYKDNKIVKNIDNDKENKNKMNGSLNNKNDINNIDQPNENEIINQFNKKVNLYLDELIKNKIDFTENKDIQLLVLEKLISLNKTIAFAESITGGGLAKTLVDIPGASNSLLGGIVSYSNKVKEKLLFVKSIEQKGAVSSEVAEEMVKGLKKQIGADINVSVTGIAGPTGGSKEKPIGLVYFGFLFDNIFFIKKQIFNGNRERIINKTILYVFLEIYKYICKF